MIAPSWELVDGSVRYPWPLAADHRGPAVRVVADDPVWQAAVRRFVERWRQEHDASLGLLRFENIAALKNAASGPQLLDLVLVTGETLATQARWIAERPSGTWTVPLLCRRSLVEPNDQIAAERLLLEAGSRDVIPTLADLPRLESLVSHANSRPQKLDPLAELPLPCWGPAWQLRP
jgi:hypothetical protein